MLKKLKVLTVRMIIVANLVTIIFMVLSGYSDHFHPIDHPFMAVSGLAFPIFLILNLLFLVFWLFFRWRMAWISMLGYIICFFPLHTYMPLNPTKSPPEGAIKVLSYNVKGFAVDDMAEDEINQAAEYILESNADIVCIQEAMSNEKKGWKIDSMFQKKYQYRDTTMQTPGDWISIYSKFPILSKDTIKYDSENNQSVAYVLDIHGEKVLVVNNHLESNKFSSNEKQGFRQMVGGELKEDSIRRESKLLLDKLINSAKLRAPQAESVIGYIKEKMDQGMSVIVCGDFNDTPISYAHKVFADALTDCYVSSGFGPGFSYHENRMFVRIDHMFCSDEWEPFGAKVDSKVKTSDHYPLICWLKKRSKP